MHDLAAFANRLRKNFASRRPWAARRGIEAYRLYDDDIPELKYTVEVFGPCVVVSVKAGRMPRPSPEGAIRAAVSEALGISAQLVQVKLRRTTGGPLGRQQYERLEARGERFVVRESGRRYLVNVVDYLDTGLFLDHRPLRDKLQRELAPASQFLNLFCYTGAVSVAAALSGAETTNIDLSRVYLEWAADNFHANGIAKERHRFLREDATRWLTSDAAKERLFDAIFLDPPTFSNSKGMQASFDVVRDHGRIVRLAAARLVPGGILWFSTNHSKFALDPSITKNFSVTDCTEASIPEDFRNRKAHRLFAIQNGAATTTWRVS